MLLTQRANAALVEFDGPVEAEVELLWPALNSAEQELALALDKGTKWEEGVEALVNKGLQVCRRGAAVLEAYELHEALRFLQAEENPHKNAAQIPTSYHEVPAQSI